MTKKSKIQKIIDAERRRRFRMTTNTFYHGWGTAVPHNSGEAILSKTRPIILYSVPEGDKDLWDCGKVIPE